MKRIIIIPARYASSRFPGKPLALISGPDGRKRPLIEHTWNAAKRICEIDTIYVATDDTRIANACIEFGARVVMTSPDCQNGTERCAMVLQVLNETPEIVINLQGDAPLTSPGFIEALVSQMVKNTECAVATPVLKCGTIAKQNLMNDRQNGRVGGTTAVFDALNRAIYFSKEVLPYGGGDVFHHVGVYAYRPEALAKYVGWEEGQLEKSEGLEQLRFLENGIDIQCVEVTAQGREFWEVNNPDDISIVENILRLPNAV